MFFFSRTGYARISHGGLSDTEVQVGRFQVPVDPDNYVDNKKTVTNPSVVDASVLFSPK